MRSKIWICAILVCAAGPPAAARKKLAGKVLDAAAFAKVKTYCVDTSNLGNAPGEWINAPQGASYVGSAGGVGDVPRPLAFDVGQVVTRESGPKGLLSKSPWKLEASCFAPGVDAIVRFNFSITAGIPVQPATDQPTQQQRLMPRGWRAQLRVSNASSGVIYQAEEVPLGNNLGPTDIRQVDLDHKLRQAAAYDALAALVSDVKTVAKNP